jgi:hypothetical protein
MYSRPAVLGGAMPHSSEDAATAAAYFRNFYAWLIAQLQSVRGLVVVMVQGLQFERGNTIHDDL